MSNANELKPSELGTQEYWEKVYSVELQQLVELDDSGTEWFGPTTTKRMVKWLQSCSDIPKEASIIDLGCGNGLLLLALATSGYRNMLGVDYCNSALELANGVFQREGFGNDSPKWLQLDITRQTLVKDSQGVCKVTDLDLSNTKTSSQGLFKVCLDKGTYDAISLCPNDSHAQRQAYARNVTELLVKGGYLVIASCNWTSNELQSHFTNLQFLSELPAPTFSFGGKTGKSVSTCVFRKL